uniref:DENN/MADD domain containing 6B n=1 Tax=Hucho hucho TaxID=62062 RepID=A0A4W5NDL3_9TELE
MGVVMQVRIPSKNDKPGGSPVKQAQKEVAIAFYSFLIHLHMLWELMLLGEPVVIMAPSPTVSSETVLALSFSHTTVPLRYCCDYRLYFTIHDTEFKKYTTTTQAPPNVILGNTNPFFIKTFQSWPHIRLGELKMSGDLPKQVKKLAKLKTLDTKAGKTYGVMEPTWFERVSNSEVEIVDLVLKRREKLMKAGKQQLPVKEGALEKLEGYLQTIINSLPEDLQTVLYRY